MGLLEIPGMEWLKEHPSLEVPRHIWKAFSDSPSCNEIWGRCIVFVNIYRDKPKIWFKDRESLNEWRKTFLEERRR